VTSSAYGAQSGGEMAAASAASEKKNKACRRKYQAVSENIGKQHEMGGIIKRRSV